MNPQKRKQIYRYNLLQERIKAEQEIAQKTDDSAVLEVVQASEEVVSEPVVVAGEMEAPAPATTRKRKTATT